MPTVFLKKKKVLNCLNLTRSGEITLRTKKMGGTMKVKGGCGCGEGGMLSLRMVEV